MKTRAAVGPNNLLGALWVRAACFRFAQYYMTRNIYVGKCEKNRAAGFLEKQHQQKTHWKQRARAEEKMNEKTNAPTVQKGAHLPWRSKKCRDQMCSYRFGVSTSALQAPPDSYDKRSLVAVADSSRTRTDCWWWWPNKLLPTKAQHCTFKYAHCSTLDELQLLVHSDYAHVQLSFSEKTCAETNTVIVRRTARWLSECHTPTYRPTGERQTRPVATRVTSPYRIECLPSPDSLGRRLRSVRYPLRTH